MTKFVPRPERAMLDCPAIGQSIWSAAFQLGLTNISYELKIEEFISFDRGPAFVLVEVETGTKKLTFLSERNILSSNDFNDNYLFESEEDALAWRIENDARMQTDPELKHQMDMLILKDPDLYEYWQYVHTHRYMKESLAWINERYTIEADANGLRSVKR